MNGPAGNVPSGNVPNPIPVGSRTPAAVKAPQLSNPPSARALPGGPTPSYSITAANPFQAFPAIDVLNVKAALLDRLGALESDPVANAENIASTRRMLAVANAKLVPRSPTAMAAVAPLPLPGPIASGVKSNPPGSPPPASG